MQNRAVQIVRVERQLDGSSSYVFDKESLQRIVCDPRIKGKKICVVSIVGKFRQGKSVAANSFVRYLHHLAKAQTSEARWLSDTPAFDCFEWRTAVDGVTTGIWICPDVVTLRTPDGEEVAVLIMDTQGIDDPNADSDESILVFGLPLLLSSVTVYNVKDRISLNELEHAQFYSEYGRMAVEMDEGLRPFQTLTFLLRDWAYAEQHPYGFDGGRWYLYKLLQARNNEEVKEFIGTSFRKLQCCLLPHPGPVVTGKTFTGDIMEATDDFQQEFAKLAHALFSPGLLEKKVMCGKSVTCGEWFEYFDAYMTLFISGGPPHAHSILETTANIQNSKLRDECITKYRAAMEQALHHDVWVNLSSVSEQERRLVLADFDAAHKFGGEQLATPYKNELVRLTEEAYKELEEQCKMKRLKIVEEAKADRVHECRKQMTKLMTESESAEPLSRAEFRQHHEAIKESAVDAFRTQFAAFASSEPKHPFDADAKELLDRIDGELISFEKWNESHISAAERRSALEKQMEMEQREREAALEQLRETMRREQEQYSALEEKMRIADEQRASERREREQERALERERLLQELHRSEEQHQRKVQEMQVHFGHQLGQLRHQTGEQIQQLLNRRRRRKRFLGIL